MAITTPTPAAISPAPLDNARPTGYDCPMLRLLALSLLALAAPQAAAEQVHPCQAETPPCSVGRPLHQSYLDRYAGNEKPALIHTCQAENPPCSLGLAQTLRELDELIGEAGPGAWETPAERIERRNRTRQPRHYVPYPLSRELLTGAVNPCAGSRPACPWELENIYNGLERTSDDKNSWHYEYYLFQLEKYYRHRQP